ncbi:MAG: aromatic-ring-hydroxylating dioxygenase subunit beta [Variovorax sp.]|nr:aromatic-ring-hydroxylating dioxygenase subunit beta [Variovorax sp.]
MNAERKSLAVELVALEAQLLDEQNWNAWLDLYLEDAVLWVPTWRSESELSQDPMTELSFMHLEGRAFLRERVQRVISGRSVASLPIPRTAHLVAGSLATAQDDGDGVLVKSAWNSHVFQHKDGELVSYAGRYEHTLRWVVDGSGGAYRIQRKKIVLANDFLRSQLDFFYL